MTLPADWPGGFWLHFVVFAIILVLFIFLMAMAFIYIERRASGRFQARVGPNRTGPFGIFQPVGDSVMPGGISRAMRMIPALVDIAEDVKALCPDAWFFNYSNPMTANCWAIRQATSCAVVGLCHGSRRYCLSGCIAPAGGRYLCQT